MRHPAPAQGRLHRAGVDRRRRVLDPPAARRRGRHHAVQLPGDGADVDVRQRPRVRQHVRAQAEREGPVGVAAPRRAARQGRAPGRVLQRRAGRQGRRRPRCSSTPTSRPSASSARRRSPSTSTRPAPPTASGCRRSAGPRTTCSCCPTPTSTWPPTPPISAGYGSAGERCMAISVVLAVDVDRRRPRRQDRRADPVRSRSAPGTEPDTEMGPLISGEHRDKVRGYVDGAAEAGATVVVDGRDDAPGRWLLPQPDAARRRHARHGLLPATRSSARCCR